jgi:NitT/TauT family transport system ATP-binding protein
VFLSERIYMLSSHPGRVVEEIPIPFGRNRTHDILRASDFQDLVAYTRDRVRVWAPQAAHQLVE